MQSNNEVNDELQHGSNNSMPIANKDAPAPAPPEEIEAYNYGLTAMAKQYRETLRPYRQNYATIYFRFRRKNFESLLWMCFSQGLFKKSKMYSRKCLHYWTISMKIRILNNYPLGAVMESVRQRLGIYSPGLKFCIDGFFGMTNYSNIFGHTADNVCPWMEISAFSTANSLSLRSGDSIFVSLATQSQIDGVTSYRRHELSTGSTKRDRPEDQRAGEASTGI